MTVQQILTAASAMSIPAGASGVWTVKKTHIKTNTLARAPGGKIVMLEEGVYTHLYCHTEAHAMQNHGLGDLVMEDSSSELLKHLNFILRAHGRVLITGLGLGCVIRGCLVNPRVKEVTCIERDADVIKLVGRHMPKDPRLKIIAADALEWVPAAFKAGTRFDCCWHDLWTNPDRGEPHLAIWHNILVGLCYSYSVPVIGAWALPRDIRRAWLVAKGQEVL